MQNSSTINIEKYTKNIRKYEIKTYYSGWGWFLFTFIGMSATPTKVEFLERESGKVVESSTDPQITKQFVGR